MMSGEAWLYLLAVLINAVNLFLQVFFTIMYSDLEWCAKDPPCPFSAIDPFSYLLHLLLRLPQLTNLSKNLFIMTC